MSYKNLINSKFLTKRKSYTKFQLTQEFLPKNILKSLHNLQEMKSQELNYILTKNHNFYYSTFFIKNDSKYLTKCKNCTKFQLLQETR